MAQIRVDTTEKITSIKTWLGLNESPDGDVHLKPGEASIMENFQITREGHLKLRPGYSQLCTLSNGNPVRALWTGFVNGNEKYMAVCGGHLWDVDLNNGTASDCGSIEDGPSHLFGFSNKLYILSGQEYYCWNGTDEVAPVEGYIPTVVTATAPAGGGTLLQDVNKLTGKKRQQFSPDGEATEFFLVETELDEIISVEGTDISYTSDLTAGKITFESAPEKGVNTITITWRKGEGDREKVTKMRFSEFYNGGSDGRVFLYGDGSNQAIYSGLDENGKPSAEYFPDLNVLAAGEENTPITGMIRHYDRLLVFTSSSAYSAQYSSITLADGRVSAAFYVDTLNREIGCTVPGQLLLVENNARTIFRSSIYDWALITTSTRDERNAKRVSDKVTTTMSEFAENGNLSVYDDNSRQEYYIFCNGKAIVQNYGNKAWYVYTDFPALCMMMRGEERYFGTANGEIMHLSQTYRSSNGKNINAVWESGSMAFDQNYREKHSSFIWIVMKPELQSRVTVIAESDRYANYVQKILSSNVANFLHVNFNHWSFATNQNPKTQRAMIKVKRATFYKLIFRSNSASSSVTILAADIQSRNGAIVK